MRSGSGVSGGRRDVWLMGALGLVVIVLATLLIFDSKGSNGNEAATQAEAGTGQMGPVGDMSRRIDGDPLALGSVDAPVVLVAYSDYRCPFCAQFSRDTEPELIDRYVESGVLRIEWRDLPIFGEQSMNAARAGRAAAAQGKFWEFNRALYAAAPSTGHPDLSADVLRGFAEEAGVPDLDKFGRDAAGTVADSAIMADIMEAKSIGVNSTPSFVINGNPILGAQPLPIFIEVIDEAAKNAS